LVICGFTSGTVLRRLQIPRGVSLPKAVVLGGYGLIGLACCRVLQANGFSVVGVGRSRATAMRVAADIDWAIHDIAKMRPGDWATLLAGVDVVVNAAGALQDGSRDSVTAIHEEAVGLLIAAMTDGRARLIQISAAGVSAGASTEFFRSKARGDARIMASSLDWVILRPTLVISAQAYGGTALLRAAAAMPLVFAKVHPNAPIQTVWVEDLANAVLQAAKGDIPSRSVADITEAEVRSMAETVVMFRHWLGFPPWKCAFRLPVLVLRLVGYGADALGWLGWRSPFRTTALRTLADGVQGSAESWAALGGAPARGLAETLARIPATVQERWFARLYLLLPLVLATLAVFWVASGLIGLVRFDEARAVLLERGFSRVLASVFVAAGSVIDVALGLAVLWRPSARVACFGMIGVAIGYLAASALFAPDLWLDPLGPMVKVVPSVTLALIAAALLDER
jgi:uncharacterized protein YbjT (DUF2867 family)